MTLPYKNKNMNIKTLLLALLLIGSSSFLFAQGNVTTEIKIVVAKIKKGQDANLKSTYFTESNAKLIIAEAEKHVFDKSATVRKTMYKYIHRASLKVSENEIKQKGVELLSRACLDNDSRASIIAANFLSDFGKENFTLNAKIQLSSAFSKRRDNLPQVILLLGYLQMKQHEQELLAYASTSPDDKIKWNASVALARMGNADGIEMCVNEFTSLKQNDDLIFFKVPGMLYTCQKACYEPVIEILNSTEKSCSSTNPDNETAILCAYRVMEMLAPYIEGFPFETHVSGDIKADSYENALAETKLWFKKKKDKYTINTEQF